MVSDRHFALLAAYNSAVMEHARCAFRLLVLTETVHGKKFADEKRRSKELSCLVTEARSKFLDFVGRR